MPTPGGFGTVMALALIVPASTTMQEPGNHDNEIIGDSEGDHGHTPHATAVSLIQNSTFPDDSHSGGQENASTHASDVSTFSFDRPVASISSGTSTIAGIETPISSDGANAVDAAHAKAQELPEGSTAKPRVRPRPAYRKKDQAATTEIHSSINPFTSLNLSIDQENNALFSDIQADPYPAVASIADRAKMRSRNAKSSTIDTAPSGSSSSRSETSKRRVNPSDVIELSSSDELSLRPAGSKKPKSKPRTRLKIQSHPTEPVNVADTASKPRPRPRPAPRKKSGLLSPPQVCVDPGSQGTIPLPTSPADIPIQNPFDPLSSQLPPSDPPTSTAPAHDPEPGFHDTDLPPIETLANPASDAPTSSPSSLFTPPRAPKSKNGKNRKTAVDELEFDDSDGAQTRERRAGMLPPAEVPQAAPPPTFFAASSSLPPPDQDPGLPTTPMEQQNPIVDIVDLSDLPPTIQLTAAKKGTKPRKSRAKKCKDVDVGGAGGDTEPTKAPAKGKRKGKNAKNAEAHDGVLAPPTNSAKGMGRQAPKSAFVNDMDTDTDDRAILVKRKSPEKMGGSSAKPDSLTSLSSIPDSQEEGGAIRLSSRKRKSEGGMESPSKKRKGKGKEVGDNASDVQVGKEANLKGKERNVVQSDSEEEETHLPTRKKLIVLVPPMKSRKGGKKLSVERGKGAVPEDSDEALDGRSISVQDDGTPSKENTQPAITATRQAVTIKTPKATPTPAPETPKEGVFPSLTSRYTIAPRAKSTPMSELIRRVNSLPGSPFPSPHPRASSSIRTATPGLAYSPYLKSSRSLLSRIAPLHPNRRTPPPPLPPPPPPKKTKKEKEREERWEEELVESVGGISEWACMTDAERKELRRAKREREMAGWED